MGASDDVLVLVDENVFFGTCHSLIHFVGLGLRRATSLLRLCFFTWSVWHKYILLIHYLRLFLGCCMSCNCRWYPFGLYIANSRYWLLFIFLDLTLATSLLLNHLAWYLKLLSFLGWISLFDCHSNALLLLRLLVIQIRFVIINLVDKIFFLFFLLDFLGNFCPLFGLFCLFC